VKTKPKSAIDVSRPVVQEVFSIGMTSLPL
jgi:hypothetical protein